MFGAKDASDKSLRGLSVGLWLAVTIAATVIVFAYAATGGPTYSSPATAVPTETDAAEITLPVDNSDTKQELQLVQQKVQEDGIADKLVTEQQQIQQTNTAIENKKPASTGKVDPAPIDETEIGRDDSSSPTENDEEQGSSPVTDNSEDNRHDDERDESDLTPAEDNDDGGLTVQLPIPLPVAHGDSEHDDAGTKEDRHEKHEGKKHDHTGDDDKLSSISFKKDD